MEPKILSIGSAYLDITCPHFPYGSGLVPGKEVVGEKYELALGGSALIFARVSAAIGLPPVFVGKIGRDDTGQILERLAFESGITPSFIHDQSQSTLLGIAYTDKAGKSIMTVVGTAGKTLEYEEIKGHIDEYLGKVGYLYIGGCLKQKKLLPHYKEIAERAKKMGVKIILDHGRVTNIAGADDIKAIKDLLPNIDFYFPAMDEFLDIWSSDTAEEAIEKVRSVSGAVIAIKDAEDGVIGFDGKEVLRVPAFPVKVLHTVGAGDSFNAGFIKARDMGLDFSESLRFGCATAALKISRESLPTFDEIKRLIKGK